MFVELSNSRVTIKGIHNMLNKYIQAEPKIITNFKIAQNHNNKQLSELNFKFSSNYWIDVSRVDEINSLNEYSIVVVEFKVEFENKETKQWYERYVDQLKTDLATNYDVSKNDIVTKTTFEMGHQKDGILIGKNLQHIVDFISLFPLTRYIMPGLFTIMKFPHFKVKKIISQTAMEINAF